MKQISSVLDMETQLLVAVGSAVAANCIPCLETIAAQARTHGIDEKKLRAAARTGQFVKEQPANHIKAFADKVLGTHLQSEPASTGCGPAESGQSKPAQAANGPLTGGCSCA